MIDARNEIMQATPLEVPTQPLEEHQYILDTLSLIEPPRESERALAKYAVQRSLRLNFNAGQHIKSASPQAKGRTWGGMILKIRHQQYGDTAGCEVSDLETEALMLDLWESVYD